MKMHELDNLFAGELVIYKNGGSCEIGKVKRVCDDGAFVWYHGGSTASKTPYQNIHKLVNRHCVIKTVLGGLENET